MALILQPAPPAGYDAVRDNLMVGSPQDPAAARDVLEGGVSDVQVLDPYPVYTGDARALRDGNLLGNARLTAWHYVVVDGSSLQLAEVAGEASFASFQPEEATDALLDVMEAAEKLDFVKKADYDLRILRVPEMYFTAVWLHRDGDDWLLPVRPAPTTLQPGAIMREAAVAQALAPIANTRLQPLPE